MDENVEELIKKLNKNIFVRRKAVKELVKIGKPAIEPLIVALGNSYSKTIQCMAAEVLGNIGDVKAVEPLIGILKYSNKYIRKYAIEALGRIGSLKAIQPLVETLRIAADMDEHGEVIYHINRALTNIRRLNSQLFCLQCLLRGKRKTTYILAGNASGFYPYIFCRNCYSVAHLIKDIKHAIGLIGGDITDYKQDGEKVYVNLWFESEKKARNADIDVLEIREADGISYDWTVNAVLNELKNDVSRPRKYVKGIPVIIRGNPPLSENSKMILTHEFGGISKG